MKKALIITLITCLCTVAALVCIDIFAAEDKTELIGEETVYLEYGTAYEEQGIRAVRQNRLSKITKEYAYEIQNGVGESIGVYEVLYTVSNRAGTQIKRYVIVCDTKAPEIFAPDETVKINPRAGYNLNLKAYDAKDGDVSETITYEIKEDRLIVYANDKEGNIAQKEIQIEFVDSVPVICLLGETNERLTELKPYQDPGFTALDEYGNDLSAAVKVTGKVRGAIATQSAAGKQLIDPYVLTYSYTNEAGKTVSVQRTVNIIAPPAPKGGKPRSNTLFLTFDDGPSAYTSRLLDILKKNEVTAAFFVTGTAAYRSMIGRAYREGHVIGAHCYVHAYNTIYASLEAYLDDLQKIQDVIYEQTGAYTRFVRFPGGTSNTVSKKCVGLMTTLSKLIPQMGYQYFDWNASCGDGADHTAEETLAYFKQYVQKQKSGEIMMLCHDTKYNTVCSVEEMILWAKAEGKEFGTVDLTIYPHHHGPKN